MAHFDHDRRVRIISQGYNTWRVQILFPEAELDTNEITSGLKEVKKELAKQFGIGDNLLEYTRLFDKQVTRNGLLVQMQIVKHDMPSGAPRFFTQPLKGEDGTLYSDMILLADLYPYDEFSHPLSRNVIESRLVHGGFPLAFIKWDVVDSILADLEKNQKPLLEVEIARGEAPSSGQSSRLTYGIRTDQERFLTTAWMGVRPVRTGDFLVEISQATSGRQWGKNIYGREIEPRPGIQTKLEAGNGTKLMLRDSQLVATASGLLVFERSGRDRRDRDTYDFVPAKLIGHVLPVKEICDPTEPLIELQQAAKISGNIPAGTKIFSSSSLLIEGNLEKDSRVVCAGSMRVYGYSRKAEIECEKHLCIHGEVSESRLIAGYTLLIDGTVTDSKLVGSDVIAREIRGGSVEALRQPAISFIDDTGGAATAVRINLGKLLENQQQAGREAMEDLRRSLTKIIDIFGTEITLQTTQGTEQRLLLKWLKQQKMAGIGNYTHMEVQELRSVLEMVPLIRQQLASIGMELKDVTAQLMQAKTENPAKEE